MGEIKKTYILINSLGGGGAERQISYMAQLPEIEKIICIEPILEYDIPNDKIVFLSKRPARKSIISKVIQIVHVLWQLKKFGISKQTHLICFLQLSLIIGILAKYLFGCRCTLSIRINPFLHAQNSNGYSLSGRLLHFLLSRADGIVPNSYDTANDLSIHFPQFSHKIHTIVNGYDIAAIDNKKNQINQTYSQIFSRHNCLLTSGRLDKQKGQWHLLRIIAALKKENISCKLFIMGEGEMLDDLVTLSEMLALSTFVFSRNDLLSDQYDIYFIGFQKNPYYFYHHANLFLFPSIYEGLPNALIESLICGTTAISTNCKSGPYEIMMRSNDYKQIENTIETPYGYLTPVFDGEVMDHNKTITPLEDSWKRLIHHYIQNPKKVLDTKGILARYSMQQLSDNWRDFILRTA